MNDPRHLDALVVFIFHQFPTQHSDLYRQVEESLNYLILGLKQNPNISWGRGKREEVILDRFEHSLTYNLHTTWVSFIWEKYDQSDVKYMPGLSSIQSDISLTFQFKIFIILPILFAVGIMILILPVFSLEVRTGIVSIDVHQAWWGSQA